MSFRGSAGERRRFPGLAYDVGVVATPCLGLPYPKVAEDPEEAKIKERDDAWVVGSAGHDGRWALRTAGTRTTEAKGSACRCLCSKRKCPGDNRDECTRRAKEAKVN